MASRKKKRKTRAPKKTGRMVRKGHDTIVAARSELVAHGYHTTSENPSRWLKLGQVGQRGFAIQIIETQRTTKFDIVEYPNGIDNKIKVQVS